MQEIHVLNHLVALLVSSSCGQLLTNGRSLDGSICNMSSCSGAICSFTFPIVANLVKMMPVMGFSSQYQNSVTVFSILMYRSSE